MSDIYTRLCSALLFPLHEKLKRHDSPALRRELERSQWWPRERIEAAQLQRLRGFLATAARDVPYYQRTFAAAGVDPARVSSLADLQRVPRLTKDLIRDNTDAMKSRRAGRLIRYTTGGSSGSPLVFYMGMDRVTHDVASKWRATRWWNVDIGDREVVLWGSPIELGAQDRMRAVRDKLFRTRLFPAFQMSPVQMDGYLAELRRLRPRMLFGYASALALLAAHAEGRGVDMRGIGARVAFATGETLYPAQREIIERVFGAPVANGYGSRDAGFIAHQCPSGSLHLTAEHILVELLDDDGAPVSAGQSGEIVVTHMATSDFPFIRYRTGDRAVMQAEPCACGRGLPVLREVQGRTTDFVHTADGNTMHALALIYEVRERPGVRAFKFIQQADLSLDLQLVVDEGFSAGTEQAIRAGVLRRMGENSTLRIQRVERIEAERSGKYRYVISHAQPVRRSAA
jgi:phenylacetate-CoA ligase